MAVPHVLILCIRWWMLIPGMRMPLLSTSTIDCLGPFPLRPFPLRPFPLRPFPLGALPAPVRSCSHRPSAGGLLAAHARSRCAIGS